MYQKEGGGGGGGRAGELEGRSGVEQVLFCVLVLGAEQVPKLHGEKRGGGGGGGRGANLPVCVIFLAQHTFTLSVFTQETFCLDILFWHADIFTAFAFC